MAKINLLPWREELRKQQMQEFAVILVFVLIGALVVAFAWDQAKKKAVEYQQARNNYIDQQIALMDDQIKEIDELQKRRDALIERMTVIQGLQGNRPTIVHIFDQFAATLPDGVYYTALKQTGNKFDVTGIAESNNRVSNLMRSLESSPWFINPQLNKVMAKGDAFEFSLTVQLRPNPVVTAAPAAQPAAAAAPAQPATPAPPAQPPANTAAQPAPAPAGPKPASAAPAAGTKPAAAPAK